MTSLISNHPCLSPLTNKNRISLIIMFMCDIVHTRLCSLNVFDMKYSSNSCSISHKCSPLTCSVGFPTHSAEQHVEAWNGSIYTHFMFFFKQYPQCYSKSKHRSLPDTIIPMSHEVMEAVANSEHFIIAVVNKTQHHSCWIHPESKSNVIAAADCS